MPDLFKHTPKGAVIYIYIYIKNILIAIAVYIIE